VLDLVHLRVSRINGCSLCVGGERKSLRKLGVSDERIGLVAAWRETPYYTDEERAALAPAESVTRLADRVDAVPDDVWTRPPTTSVRSSRPRSCCGSR
jgi:AhpD family alkylhydroperoxidase